jgi:hypothetical protein
MDWFYCESYWLNVNGCGSFGLPAGSQHSAAVGLIYDGVVECGSFRCQLTAALNHTSIEAFRRIIIFCGRSHVGH